MGGSDADADRAQPTEQKHEIAAAKLNLDKVAAIVAAAALLITAITSYLDYKSKQYEAFTQAVQTEHGFWQAQLDSYFESLESGITEKEEIQRGRALRRIVFTNRVPDFEQFEIDFLFAESPARGAALERLSSLRDTVVDIMNNSDTSSATARAEFANEEFAIAEAQTVAAGAEVEEDTASLPIREVPTTIVYETINLSLGQAGGWNVDVFWCRAENSSEAESINYTLAARKARLLARYADNGDAILGQEKLGRVRVRPLPVSRQGGPYPSLGDENQVRGEPSERAEVRLLANILNTDQTPFAWRARNASPTSRYLSVFVCAGILEGDEAS